MTASRAKLMVRAPIAKSAFPPINSEKKKMRFKNTRHDESKII